MSASERTQQTATTQRPTPFWQDESFRYCDEDGSVRRAIVLKSQELATIIAGNTCPPALAQKEGVRKYTRLIQRVGNRQETHIDTLDGKVYFKVFFKSHRRTRSETIELCDMATFKSWSLGKEYLSLIKDSQRVALRNGNVERIYSDDSTLERQDAFTSATKDYIKFQDDTSVSFFSIHSEKANNIGNGITAIYHLLSIGAEARLVGIIFAFVGIVRGLICLVANSMSTYVQERSIAKMGIKKGKLWGAADSFDFVCKIVSIAASCSLLLACAAIFTGALLAKEGLVKFGDKVKLWAYCNVIGNLISAISMLVAGIRCRKVWQFRRKVNQSLENAAFTDSQKTLAYLMTVRDYIGLTTDEIGEIHVKAQKELVRKKAKEQHLEEKDVDTNLKGFQRELNRLQASLMTQATQKKLDRFKGITSLALTKKIVEETNGITKIDDLIDRLIGLETDKKAVEGADDILSEDQNAALLEAKRLVMEIDESTFKYLFTQEVYVILAAISLALGIAAAIVTAPAHPLLWIFAWLILAVLYMMWDADLSKDANITQGEGTRGKIAYVAKVIWNVYKDWCPSNNKITAFAWRRLRKKRVMGWLDLQEEALQTPQANGSETELPEYSPRRRQGESVADVTEEEEEEENDEESARSSSDERPAATTAGRRAPVQTPSRENHHHHHAHAQASPTERSDRHHKERTRYRDEVRDRDNVSPTRADRGDRGGNHPKPRPKAANAEHSHRGRRSLLSPVEEHSSNHHKGHRGHPRRQKTVRTPDRVEEAYSS